MIKSKFSMVYFWERKGMKDITEGTQMALAKSTILNFFTKKRPDVIIAKC